jgi:hypothetical protein
VSRHCSAVNISVIHWTTRKCNVPPCHASYWVINQFESWWSPSMLTESASSYPQWLWYLECTKDYAVLQPFRNENLWSRIAQKPNVSIAQKKAMNRKFQSLTASQFLCESRSWMMTLYLAHFAVSEIILPLSSRQMKTVSPKCPQYKEFHLLGYEAM